MNINEITLNKDFIFDDWDPISEIIWSSHHYR